MNRWGLMLAVTLMAAACDSPSGLSRRTRTQCAALETPTQRGRYSLTRISTAPLSFPVAAVEDPTEPGHWFAVQQTGQLVSFRLGDESATTVIDLASQLYPRELNWEAGLLGLALAPDFAATRQVYLYYTAVDDDPAHKLKGVLSRWTLDASGESAGEEQQVLTVSFTEDYHHAGSLAFGLDGNLFISLGDGGPYGDAEAHAQNLGTLRGTILRITPLDAGPYDIPADNPFVNTPGARAEIFAYGFRNPWKISVDRQTGELWMGDVGFNDLEEVNRVVAGGNYGWPIFEGTVCYQGPCEDADVVPPVVQYSHDGGRRAVTAGYVYRGAIASLSGAFVYADFSTGEIYGWFGDQSEVLLDSFHQISSFAQAEDGELHIVSYAAQGHLYRLDESTLPPREVALPAFLTQTGCADWQEPTEPSWGMIPYEVNAPLYSDGATKRRWLSVPKDARVEVGPDGDWLFPVGSVLRKDFALDDRLIETRLMMHHDDGLWGGYSYKWNEEQTDARLLDDGETVEVGDQTWAIPSRTECFRCHTDAAGLTLGLETRQLAREMYYPDAELDADQLLSLKHVQLFADADAAGLEFDALPDPSDPLHSIDRRARAYLHSNCSACHRPDGPGGGNLDLRFESESLGVCEIPQLDDLGLTDANIIAPGDPDRSVLWLRMGRRDQLGMPPLGTGVVDEAAMGWIRRWIEEMPGCPP